jgi:hypothetical protein
LLAVTTTVHQLVARSAFVVIIDVNEHLIELSVNTLTLDLVKAIVRCPVILANGTFPILQCGDVFVTF